MKAHNKLKVGILGVGSIGRSLATALDEKVVDAELVALCDVEFDRATEFAAGLQKPPRVVSLHEMIQRADIIVEAANQAVLEEFIPKAIAGERDVLVMSAGGLLGREDWFSEAARKGCRIYVPSGAIAGLDGIKSASMGRLESVVLTSRKPIAALRTATYVVEHGLDLEKLENDTVIFEGTAEEAVRAFPSTSNVAASLRLALNRTVPVMVKVVAVPRGNRNMHEIRVQGEFGRFSMDVENVPSKSNPRTSQLAAYSVLATLTNLTKSLRVGT